MQELERDYYRCNLSPSSAMEIGIMKADSVSWQLIVDILAAFRKWTEICITTPIFSVSVNGALHGYFHGANGLRQGDFLAPWSFYFSHGILFEDPAFS